MEQTDKTREQLMQEIAALRQRNGELEASQARYQQMEQALLASEARHRRLASEQALLAEIGRIISASLDISEVYEPFARAVRKLFAFDRMTISLVDHDRQIITNIYVTGAQIPARQTGYTIPLAGTLTEAVLRNPAGFFLHPRREAELRQQLPGLLPFYRSGLRSFLAVGLISRDQTIGALMILSYQPDFFTDDALRLAISVSSQIASAIANAQSYLKQQQAEAALRESEAHHRILAEKSLQGISITRDGKRLFANSALAKMLGYVSPDDVMAADPWSNVAPHEHKRFNMYKRKRRQGQPAPTYYVYQGVKKDGTLIWLENTVSRIVWNGQPATLKTVFEITERVQAEKRLKQMYAELEQRVAARTVALEASNRHLQQEIAERSRSEAALRLSETRWRSLVENAPATITELDASGIILYTSRGWQGLTRDEMVGTPIDDYFPPDQRTVLHHAMRQARQTRTMQQYEVALPSPAGAITYYAYRLTVLVLYNVVSGFLLVSNDVTDQKAVEAVESDSDRITIRTGRVEAQVQIDIYDNGRGIAEAHMPHIFDPFYTTPQDKGGTGLGLSITHGIISDHGGTIDVESKPGDGTAVCIRLPCVPSVSHFASRKFTF